MGVYDLNVLLNQGRCAKPTTCCSAHLCPQDGESEAFFYILTELCSCLKV